MRRRDPAPAQTIRSSPRGCGRTRANRGAGQPSSSDQQRHPHHRDCRVAALVALVAAGALERLVHVLDREHAEGAGHAGLELDLLDTARRLGADVVVVAGLAADHGAEAGDAVKRPLRAASWAAKGSSKAPGTSKASIAPGSTPPSAKPATAPLGQPWREIRIEGADADREALAGKRLALGIGRRRKVVLSHLRRRPRAGARPRAARRGSSPRRGRGPGGAGCGRACRAWCAGSPRCGGWGPPRSGPGR